MDDTPDEEQPKEIEADNSLKSGAEAARGSNSDDGNEQKNIIEIAREKFEWKKEFGEVSSDFSHERKIQKDRSVSEQSQLGDLMLYNNKIII